MEKQQNSETDKTKPLKTKKVDFKTLTNSPNKSVAVEDSVKSLSQRNNDMGSGTKATPAPRDLICPEALEIEDVNSEKASGASFNPVLHQSRRDLYGGDRKKGIPKGLQHILYDISNAVIKRSNYGEIDNSTGKVLNDTAAIYGFLATYMEHRLTQRQERKGKLEDGENEQDERGVETSATLHMHNPSKYN